jgi:hypothetical protein
MTRWVRALFGLAAMLVVGIAHGHAASTAYVDVGASTGTGTSLLWAVALRDLDAVLDLDANADGQLAWSEVAARRTDIEQLAVAQLRVTAKGAPCALGVAPLRYSRLESGGYAVLDLTARCANSAEPLALDYRFLDRLDATHRVLLTLPGARTPRPVAPGQPVALPPPGASDATTASSGFGALLATGVTHIVGGADHLLFLVALLLPAVLRRDAGRWIARTDIKPALVEVIWIATAITAAHSITLGLASFHLVSLPARLIEPLIAFTVLAAALNNLKPLVTRRLALVAFCFGLIHGFGFAEVLAPLSLPAGELAVALLGFNLGVEAGQLAIVAGAFTLLALARRWHGYPRWILGGGSAALAAIASVWIVERVLDVPLLAHAFAAG